MSPPADMWAWSPCHARAQGPPWVTITHRACSALWISPHRTPSQAAGGLGASAGERVLPLFFCEKQPAPSPAALPAPSELCGLRRAAACRVPLGQHALQGEQGRRRLCNPAPAAPAAGDQLLRPHLGLRGQEAFGQGDREQAAAPSPSPPPPPPPPPAAAGKAQPLTPGSPQPLSLGQSVQRVW